MVYLRLGAKSRKPADREPTNTNVDFGLYRLRGGLKTYNLRPFRSPRGNPRERPRELLESPKRAPESQPRAKSIGDAPRFDEERGASRVPLSLLLRVAIRRIIALFGFGRRAAARPRKTRDR